MNFCHLHVHSTYSQLDGFGVPKDFVEEAKKKSFEYLACTDHGNIDGLIKFQKACLKEDIKTVLGCEAYIAENYEEENKKKTGHITLWIKNAKGFKNICRLLSIANSEGFYYKPRINFHDLLKYSEGLIVGSACMKSFIFYASNGEKFLKDLKSKLKEDLYLEVMPFNNEEQIKHNKKIIALGRKLNIKIIATNDVHYPKKTNAKYQEMMLAIQSKVKWDDPKRWRFNSSEFYLKSTKEMMEALKEIKLYKKEYLTNSIEVAEKCCNFIIEKKEIDLPDIPEIKQGEENKKLKEICKNYLVMGKSILKNKIYKERFLEEYKLIKQKNFSKYFLIMWELCSWCRKNGILIGPGRGSVGGSLIAFMLGITTIDPIKHDLLFSRFINEDRIDYPDIDIDFEDSKRHLVKDHLEELYGENNIAGVSSFNIIKTRAALQDVSRVFEVPSSEVNTITKFIDEDSSISVSENIENAIESFPEVKDFSNNYPKVIKYAKNIGGQIRTNSQHAAALILSKKDLKKDGKCVVIERNGNKVINWEKEDAEYMGLMKLDALGLKLLSILSHCLKLIKEDKGEDIRLNRLDLNDEKVLEEISKGNNIGVFQLNTWAMTSLIKEFKKLDSFENIVDAIALVRPGPMNSGMTKNYIERKNGSKWKKMHKVYEKLTENTFGLLVYQEQVMAVISKIAGLPYNISDKIRKIIGKKRDKKEFEHYEKMFKDGCSKTKLFSKNEANDFWIGLQEWSKYGFNKAHSVGYAILAYWCAWLKYYYPTEFICASLTFGDKSKKPELIEEAYRIGLSIQLPKVEISDPLEWKVNNNKLLIPFNEIIGFGDKKALEAVNLNNQICTPNKKGICSFFTKRDFKEVVKISSKKKKKSKLETVLETLGSFDKYRDKEISDEIKAMFKFRLESNSKNTYKKLYDLFDGRIREDRLYNILNGDLKELSKVKDIICESKFDGYKNKNLLLCKKCELIKQCNRPVFPSVGKYNIMIIGEAPGKEEDKSGIGFIGKSGDKIWKQSKLNRKLFHVTNICKCFPKESKTPKSEEIEICGNAYLKEEIERIKPKVVLAFGNTCLNYFENKKSGIVSYSGKTTWNERFGFFICWSIHPAATMRNPENEKYFLEGIKNFKNTLKILNKSIFKNEV